MRERERDIEDLNVVSIIVFSSIKNSGIQK